jgi:hypothetical protein
MLPGNYLPGFTRASYSHCNIVFESCVQVCNRMGLRLLPLSMIYPANRCMLAILLVDKRLKALFYWELSEERPCKYSFTRCTEAGVANQNSLYVFQIRNHLYSRVCLPAVSWTLHDVLQFSSSGLGINRLDCGEYCSVAYSSNCGCWL